MYGQKSSIGIVSAGISVASWWMWGVTVALAAAAAVLLVRVFVSRRSADRRP